MRTPGAFMLAALPALAAACAQPPLIEGARCPCPDGYICGVGDTCVRTPTSVAPPAPLPDAGALTPAAGKPDAQLRCQAPGPVASRQLAADEYRNTVRDLLGLEVTEDLSSLLEQEYVVEDPLHPPSPPPPEAYLPLAEALAGRAVASLDRLTDCDRAARGEQACGQDFIERFGLRAFRRPLGDDERASLLAAFEAGRSAGGFAGGIRRVLTALLDAPPFYSLQAEPVDAAARPTTASPWTAASRLSYFLWRTMPDKELFDTAQAGGLRTAAEVRARAERMLRDPRGARMLEQFHRRWLKLDVPSPDPEAIKAGLTAAMSATLMRSADATFSHLVWERNADLRTLLTFPSVFGDRAMANFYRLTAPAGQSLEPLAPTGTQKRAGVLTSPALLASSAHGGESNPVARGMLLLQSFLCASLVPPPSGVPSFKPPSPMAMTTRERLSEHAEDPACSPCHHIIDPMGFGLENYDGYGRWRTTENGRPINARGEVRDISFDGPVELGEALAASDDVVSCLVGLWYRRAFGRADGRADACTINAAKVAFTDDARRLQSLILSLTATDAFLAPP
jgi:hypothetical protein